MERIQKDSEKQKINIGLNISSQTKVDMLEKQIERLKNQLDHQSKELSKLRNTKSELEFEISTKDGELNESRMYKELYEKCQNDITRLQKENIEIIGQKDAEYAKLD